MTVVDHRAHLGVCGCTPKIVNVPRAVSAHFDPIQWHILTSSISPRTILHIHGKRGHTEVVVCWGVLDQEYQVVTGTVSDIGDAEGLVLFGF